MLRLEPIACALLLLALPPALAAAQEPPPPAPGAPAPAPPAEPAPPPPAAPQPAQPAYPQPAQPAYPQPAYPQPAYPQPGYPQPSYPQPSYPPGYAPPPPGYGPPGYGPPGYAPPYYGPEYRYGPPPEAPPPPPPKPPALRWSVRFDPFELILRRMTFQAEVAVAGPFAIEVAPSWIWGSPYGGIDEKGFAITGNAVFYLSGLPLRGWWLKGHFEYESFSATFANPYDPSLVGTPRRLSSAIVGALFGDSLVLPRTGGFVLSGGIGIGVATAPKATLTSGGNLATPAQQATLYDGLDRVRLLGTLGLGVAF